MEILDDLNCQLDGVQHDATSLVAQTIYRWWTCIMNTTIYGDMLGLICEFMALDLPHSFVWIYVNIDVALVDWSFQPLRRVISNASIFCPRLSAVAPATAKQCSKAFNGHGGKRWCSAACGCFFSNLFILFHWQFMDNPVLSCFIHKFIDRWTSKWLWSILIMILFIVPFLQVHWSTFEPCWTPLRNSETFVGYDGLQYSNSPGSLA